MYQMISREIASFRAGDTKFNVHYTLHKCAHHQISNISVAKRRRIKSFGTIASFAYIAMCVPIFSFIGLNAAKIDLSKVVYKNTQRVRIFQFMNMHSIFRFFDDIKLRF